MLGEERTEHLEVNQEDGSLRGVVLTPFVSWQEIWVRPYCTKVSPTLIYLIFFGVRFVRLASLERATSVMPGRFGQIRVMFRKVHHNPVATVVAPLLVLPNRRIWLGQTRIHFHSFPVFRQWLVMLSELPFPVEIRVVRREVSFRTL